VEGIRVVAAVGEGRVEEDGGAYSGVGVGVTTVMLPRR